MTPATQTASATRSFTCTGAYATCARRITIGYAGSFSSGA